jgi:hypothetical protein
MEDSVAPVEHPPGLPQVKADSLLPLGKGGRLRVNVRPSFGREVRRDPDVVGPDALSIDISLLRSEFCAIQNELRIQSGSVVHRKRVANRTLKLQERKFLFESAVTH